MPIKPIYIKSPLAVLHTVPLGPGQVKSTYPVLSSMYNEIRDMLKHVSMWEGIFRLACIVTEHPEAEPVCDAIEEAMEKQQVDGALEYESMAQSIAVMRAAMALYEFTNNRRLLQRIAVWCGWINTHRDEIIRESYVRTHSADLMELLEKMYRYTGKVALLSLCDFLRMNGMNWSTILHTFGIKRPMNQIASWLETRAGMDREKDSENGLYTRQYLTAHAETLADGMRAAYVNSLYSGSRDESTAGPEGWQKIYRWHGLPCGGTSADETLEGNNPSSAMDAASLGAWAEAFALQLMTRPSAWAAEALDILVRNSLPAAFINGNLVPYQRANCVDKDLNTKDCYKTHTVTEQKVRCYARMSRAWAQVMSSAVMTSSQGCMVNLYLDGEYVMMLGGSACKMTIRSENPQTARISFQMKNEIETHVSLRVFPWMHEVTLSRNGEAVDARLDGDMLMFSGILHSGDEWTMAWENELRTTEEFHQGMAVLWGDQVMVLPVTADADWAVAAAGRPEIQDGQVVLNVQHIEGWSASFGVPGGLPILPERNNDTREVCLAPYAETPCRITVFPRVNRA